METIESPVAHKSTGLFYSSSFCADASYPRRGEEATNEDKSRPFIEI